jgi:glutamyl-tRNA synthetase
MSSSQNAPVRTRFAPSPTGYLHIGGVRTALFNWLLAKQTGGQFILRIDDTDQQRNVDQALQPILEGFRWLGMDWDEGPDVDGPHAPYFQSQRADAYGRAAEQLIASGHAYRDYATSEELQTQRAAAEKAGKTFVYDRSWMATSDQERAKFEAEGRQGVVRLKMPREGECVIQDLIRGEVRIEWASEQDHVIQRADGSCLYHLASVVDDHDFQITHVVRAAEHLPNTPRQIFIAESLGYPLPAFAHLPYVAEPGGTAKLSKRKLDKYQKNKEFAALLAHGESIAQRANLSVDPDTFNPVIIDFYREIGFLPDAILNYLLLLGWSLDGSTEKFSREQMIRDFTLQRVNKSPASFDPQKLLAFQTDRMVELDRKKKVAMVLPYLQRAGLVADPPACDIADKVGAIVDAVGDRIKMAGDILDFAFCFIPADQLEYDGKAFQKRILAAEEAKPLLTKFADQLAAADDFSAAALDTLLHEFCDRESIGMGKIIHALRVATTGSAVGFGMFETLEILGREETVRRIQRAVAIESL